MTSIIVIGSGMGGLATGIYGQACGFDTTIFEAHRLPGVQCTSWQRKGYT
jgi:phytoene dehydrogenase-like protein